MAPATQAQSQNDGQSAQKPAQERGPDDLVKSVITMVETLSSQAGYQSLKNFVQDSDQLREELASTRTAYGRNLAELAAQRSIIELEKKGFEKQHLAQREKYNNIVNEKATAVGEMAAMKKTAGGLRERIGYLEVELQRTTENSNNSEKRADGLQSTIDTLKKSVQEAKKANGLLKAQVQSATAELDEASGNLRRAEKKLTAYESFIAPMTTLQNERGSISQMFESAFHNALELFEVSLSRDLDDEQLKDERSWDAVKNDASIGRKIPLPCSNSAPAKQMRVIAGLTIYASALCEHVLRQTYLDDEGGVERALRDLSAVNVRQDTFVRAVLLKALPKRQEQSRDLRVKGVVDKVLAAVGCWMTADQQTTLRSRLQQLTAELSRGWQRVQRLDERIEPEMEFDIPEEWQPVPMRAQANTRPNNETNDSKAPRQRARAEQQPAPLSVGEVAVVVWPAFVRAAADPGAEEDSDLICRGYVLTRGDAQAAEGMTRRNTRRTARGREAAVPGVRGDVGSFLSHGPSSGSGVT